MAINIQIKDAVLGGNLVIPKNAIGLVIFAHGSGSSRFSPRNNAVATALNEAGLATLLFDLLTAEEDEIDQYTREFRFDIPLLANRLIAATHWVKKQLQLTKFNIGYFGSSTGAAAALIAAAELPELIRAVVSRGGRPDLALESLAKVKAPTLLIVGSLDTVVIDLNEQAKAKMSCECTLALVKGATHLFEEPGTLEEVISFAKTFFRKAL